MMAGEIGKMSATEMSPQISIVFKELFDEVKSTKRQQWIITNYCLLILAAVYALQLPYASPLAVITAIVGSGLLLKMQSHLARSRIRLDKVHKTYFDEQELKAIGLTDKKIKALSDEKRHYLAQYLHGWEFLFALIGVLWIGAFIVVSGAESVAL
jgi:hypothetical protein